MCLQQKSNICIICLLLYLGISRAEDHTHDVHDTDTHFSDDEPNLLPESGNKVNSNIYLDVLMRRYGNGESMTLDGFTHLLYHLGLGGSVVLDSGSKFVGHAHENEDGHYHHDHSDLEHHELEAHEHEHSDMQIFDHEHNEEGDHDHDHEHSNMQTVNHELSVSDDKIKNSTESLEEEMYDKLKDDHEQEGHVHEDRQKRATNNISESELKKVI